MKRTVQASALLVALLVMCLPMFVWAGTTGKIAGSIKDAETGEPLPGVNVVVEGTTLGAATSAKGQYSILNIPPGEYTLVATMIGYKKHIVENVQVSIDLTTTINFQLEPTVLEAGEEVTVVAERPIVQMDKTSSMSAVQSRELEAMPVENVGDVIELQAGVVNSGGIHIRGGRSGEVAYWVDGVATTDVFSGGNRANVENSAIKELQVISGTFNAEYGQAMSGIINIVTKEGGPKYHGQLKGFIGDYYTNDDLYSVIDDVNSVTDSATGTTTLNEDLSYPLRDFNPIYNGEFSLSGPVPFTKDKLTFFVNGRYFSREGHLYGREWFLPSGVPGDSSLVPLNPNQHFSSLSKLTWKMTSGLKLSYSLNYSEYENDRHFSRSYKYVPGGINKSYGHTTTHLLKLNHVLSSNTFYEVKINRLYTVSTSHLYDDPHARPYWLVHIPGDSIREEMTLDPEHVEEHKVLFDSLKQFDIKYNWVANPEDPLGYVHHDSSSAPAGYSFLRSGTNLNRSWRSTSYWIGKFDLTSQINPVHQIKTGFEARIHEMKLDTYTLQPAREPGKDEQIVPFQPMIPDISTVFHDKYTRNPREISAYIQDKIELEDIIVNAGLRFDWFDPNSVVPVDPEDPNIYDPFKDEHIYKNPSAPDSERVKYTPNERREFMHKEVDPKMQLSPRLGIAYPITDRGVIHFSYGHFFQIPEFQYLYDSPDFKLNSGGGRTVVGNADLNPQRTVQYEIGLQQQLAENLGIDVTVFYRDVRDWVGTSPLIETVRPNVAYVVYENKDYSNVRGLTLKLEKRYANNFYAKVDYTLQVAEGTYSNPTDAFHALNAEEQPRISLIPLNWDQRQTLNAQLQYRYRGWSAAVIGKYRTGLPYTPSFAKGTRVGGTTFIGLRENSARRPNISSVDLYFTKEFTLASLKFTAFAYVYNLFDQREMTGVFSDTGTAEYTTYPRLSDVNYDPNRIGTARDLLNRPEWYITPRELQLGVTIGF